MKGSAIRVLTTLAMAIAQSAVAATNLSRDIAERIEAIPQDDTENSVVKLS
jgi:hypothetical protein